MIADILRAAAELVRALTGLFRKKGSPPTTSEQIDEEPESQGDLTMVASKMLELMNKRRKK